MTLAARILAGATALALGTPTYAGQANTDIVDRFTALIGKSKYKEAESLLAPKILWATQNSPDGRESLGGAYVLYLAVSDIQVGMVQGVKCQRVDEIEVSCTFKRQNLFDGHSVDLTERYFVSDGKIARVVDTLPPEILRLAEQQKGGN